MNNKNSSDLDIDELTKLADDSLWLTNRERSLLLDPEEGFPSYLKELAISALEAERAFLQNSDKETSDYLIALRRWFADPEKTFVSFPGWVAPSTSALSKEGVPLKEYSFNSLQEISAPIKQEDSHQKQLSKTELKKTSLDQDGGDESQGQAISFSEEPANERPTQGENQENGADPEALEFHSASSLSTSENQDQLASASTEDNDTAEPSVEIESWKQPVDPFFLNIVERHSKAVVVDESEFVQLLIGSLSLDVHEKKRMLDAVPTLSQFQFDELYKVFVEERQKFKELAKDHPEDIRKLLKKQRNGIVSLKNLLSLDVAAKGVAESTLTIVYLEAEEALLRLDGATAEVMLTPYLGEHNPLIYEQFIKARKTQGLIEPEWANRLISGLVAEAQPSLASAVNLMLDLERDDSWKADDIFSRLSSYELSDELEWFRDYLLSRFHAYHDPAPNAFEQAIERVFQAIDGAIDGAKDGKHDSLGPLLLHLKRCQLLNERYSDVIALKAIDSATIVKFLNSISGLFSIQDFKRNNGEITEEHIYSRLFDYADSLGFDSLSFWRTAGYETKGNSLPWLVEVGNVLENLGFSSRLTPHHRAFWLALGEGRTGDAADILSDLCPKTEVATMLVGPIFGMQLALWERTGELSDQTARLEQEFQRFPSAENGAMLLWTLKRMRHQTRSKALRLANELMQRFWYIPEFHLQRFFVDHDLFTRSQFKPESKVALWRALSLGPSWHLFGGIFEFYRWNQVQSQDQDNAEIALLASACDTFYQGNNGDSLVVSTLRQGWDNLSLSVLILMSRQFPMDSSIYNGFSVGLFHQRLTKNTKNRFERGGLDLAAIFQANQLFMGNDSAIISNSARAFAELAHQDVALWSWALFRAVSNIWQVPQKAWNTYEVVLEASDKLHLPQLYFGAYYVGLDQGCQHSSNEKELGRLREFLSSILSDGHLRIPESFSCTGLAFLAYSIADQAEWLTEQHELLAPGHWIHDVLTSIRQLRQGRECSREEFLLTEGELFYKELCLRKDWLLLTWPAEDAAQRHTRTLSLLRELADDSDNSNYQARLEQVVDEWQRRQLYRALSGGRIAHSHSQTIQKAKVDLLSIREQLNNKLDINSGQRREILNLIKDHQRNALKSLCVWSAMPISQLDQSVANNLKADWLLAIKLSLTEGGWSRSRDTVTADCLKIFTTYFGDSSVVSVSDFERLIGTYLTAMEAGEYSLLKLDHVAKKSLRKCFDNSFNSVLHHHALQQSEMFESFRTRIRHGWLIASLKDCFSRFDLYNEGNSDQLFTPSLDKALEGLDADIRDELERLLLSLREEFNNLVSRLDKEWLWLKDTDHPEGFLDFAPEHFHFEQLYQNYGSTNLSIEELIRGCCEAIDHRATICFSSIDDFLQNRILRPLDQRLLDIGNWLVQSRESIRALPNGSHHYSRINGAIEDARKEFTERMEDYCSWFGFQEQGIRNFRFDEIILLAWRVTSELNAVLIESRTVCMPELDIKPNANSVPWVDGRNFSNLLEIFKILFQNVIYHACPNDSVDSQIEIRIWLDYCNSGKLSCRVASSLFEPARVDIESLCAMLKDENLRVDSASGKQGSGLATVQEILLNRLYGLKGGQVELAVLSDQDLRGCGSSNPGWFVVDLDVDVVKMIGPSETEVGAWVPPDVTEMAQSISAATVKVLIIEDQYPKFEALQRFVLSLFPNCGVVHAEDMETAARLLVLPELTLDLVVLDMTLPEDPLPDAPLKSLAGLDVLKLLQVHKITVPTVLVTQYSNWSGEAGQNSRQFMDELSLLCQRDFEANFIGAIRFSHTDLAWQVELKELLQTLTSEELTMERLSQFEVERKLAADPDDLHALLARAESYLSSGDCTAAITDYERVGVLSPENRKVYAGLAKAFAGLDRKEEAEEALQHYKSLGGTGLDKVRAEMLSGEMRQLKEQLRSQRQSEMMASLGQLVGGMAHEFFSPLAAIQTQIDFINRYLLADHANEGELRSSLEEIKCQKGKMAEIVDHLRELARGDKLQSSLVDVAVIARKALSLYETQFISNGIELQLDINDRLPPIMANPLRIEQMFINLLLNAKDSLVEISQGSRLINISVRLITSYSQDSIEIRVNDTGAGVPDNFRDKVFDPFFTTKEPGRGLGLGLSLVKGTVTDYGGSIYIDGPATSGAAFVVLFPVQQEAIA